MSEPTTQSLGRWASWRDALNAQTDKTIYGVCYIKVDFEGLIYRVDPGNVGWDDAPPELDKTADA